jgi:hypothetical protein
MLEQERVTKAEACLTTDWILAGFAKTRIVAQTRYREFVPAGKGQPSPWEQLQNQIYLGDDAFVQDMQSKIDTDQSLRDIPKKQKQTPIKPLTHYKRKYPIRNEALASLFERPLHAGASRRRLRRQLCNRQLSGEVA